MRIIKLFIIILAIGFANLSSAHMSGCSDLLVPGPADPNAKQRQIALALELAKLKPASNNSVFSLDPDELSTLSYTNSNHILKNVLRGQQSLRSIDRETRARLDKLIQDLQFSAVRPLIRPWSENLYGDLIESRGLIGFQLAVYPRSYPRARLQKMFTSDILQIKRAFAKEHAFVTPQFTTIYKLLRIFEVWDPKLIEDLIHVNRYNLPIGVRTAHDFKAYLTPDRLDEIFPPESLRTRMSPLREALHRFVFTLDDVESISTIILRQHLLHSIKEGAYSIEALEKGWSQPGFANRLFAAACDWVGFEAFTARVPLSLTTDYYNVIYARTH